MIPQEGTEEFKDYLVGIIQGDIRHKYYHESVEHHTDMAVHVEGHKPDKLLEINRPNEPADVKEYRLKVYKPVTKSSCDKVVNTVSRIFNPRLYRIEFKDQPSVIREGEGIHEYLTEDYPFYLSIMQYMSEVGLRQIFSDPNGVITIWPKTLDIPENEYFKPIPKYSPSHDVVDFDEDKYFVFHKEKTDRVVIIDELFRKEWKITITKNSEKRTVELVDEYQHDIGSPPCFRIGGMIKGIELPYWYNSFISGVLPHWDKVVTMTSDLDGSIVNHLYMESWEYQVECTSCSGVGYATKEIDYGPDKGKASKYNCKQCSGSGRVTARGPFGQLTINREGFENDLPPLPPKDYIKKDIEPIKELKLIISEQEQKGFSAINMEILDKIGENQSGVAKTIDRQDLDSFLLKVSNHIFKYFLTNIIYYTVIWRYKGVLQSNTLIDYLPIIHAPKDFSVLSITELMEEYKEASKTEVSPFYLRRLEEEIVNSKFGNNEEERLKNIAIIRLNPFPDKTQDDLLTDLTSNVIKKNDWIKSNYIEFLVTEAIKKDPAFLELDLIDKNSVIDQIIIERFETVAPEMVSTEGGEVPDRLDVEAEAKAKLKGTVGGVQGIIEINKAVAEGTMSESSAELLLMEIYGFDSSIASKLIEPTKQAIQQQNKLLNVPSPGNSEQD